MEGEDWEEGRYRRLMDKRVNAGKEGN